MNKIYKLLLNKLKKKSFNLPKLNSDLGGKGGFWIKGPKICLEIGIKGPKISGKNR